VRASGTRNRTKPRRTVAVIFAGSLNLKTVKVFGIEVPAATLLRAAGSSSRTLPHEITLPGIPDLKVITSFACRPTQQVTKTASAVAAAEPGNGSRQVRQALDQFTFVAAWKHPCTQNRNSFGEPVHMPMNRFANPHVSRQPCSNAARSIGRAAIKEPASLKSGRGLAGQGHRKGRGEFDQQHVGARQGRRIIGGSHRFSGQQHFASIPAGNHPHVHCIRSKGQKG